MMKISVNSDKGIGRDGKGVGWSRKDIEKSIRDILKVWKPRRSVAGFPGSGSISITFCDDRLMRKLNRKYRGKDKPTDVLSFNLGDGENLMGDIYISIPTAKRQAKEYNVSLEEELKRLAVHGLLHVLGLGHKEMRARYGN